MNVVLDTNVFISGIFWEGNYCSQIINLWKNKAFTLVSSVDILDELVETLDSFKIKLPESMILSWKSAILENSVLVHPKKKLDVIKDDSDDNKFLEAAIAGNATLIISQDKHLLNLKEFQEIKIVTPKQALSLL